MAIITTTGCLIVTALSVARERKRHLRSLLVAPHRRLDHGGQAVPGIMVAVGQDAWSRWPPVLSFTSLCRQPQPADGGHGLLAGTGRDRGSSSRRSARPSSRPFSGSSFTVPAVILSGYISPVENMPAGVPVAGGHRPLTHFIALLLKGSSSRV